MYSIYLKNPSEAQICFYKDIYINDSNKLISPKLDLTENAAGTFSFKIPPTNVGYDLIERLITEIIVKKEGTEIWSGRVLNVKEDFQKNRTMTCEGELSYLNDTIQPQEYYGDISIYNYLRSVINVHNSKINSDKQFAIGYVDSSINVTLEGMYTNYENTLTAISNITNNYGGYLNFRKENGIRYLDYIAESNRPTSGQIIRFGKNLLDFTKSYDSTEFCTAILPLGERLQNSYGITMSGIDGVDAYTTIEDINGGDPYISNASAVNEFGWIAKTVNFDTDDEEELLELAQEYLTSTQFDNMVLEANAIDLSLLEVDTAEIKVSEKIRVVSKPHGMDTYLKISKISIPLDNPANTSFTLGSEVKTSLSARSATANFDFKSYINNTLSDGSLVNIARTRAEYIANQHLTGFFTVTTDGTGSNEVYFTNQRIPEGYDPDDPLKNSNVTKYWRWNMGVLEYVNVADDKIINGVNTHQPRLALTQDGEIVADRVSTGVLQDQYDGKHFYLNFNTGEVKMNVTSLNIQGVTAATQTYADDAAAGAVEDLSGYTILNKIKNGNYLGLYYSSNQFYISASYIKTGTLELGGYVGGSGQGGVLNVYDSNANLTHKLNNDGLSGYSHNYNSGTYYVTRYGKSGTLNDNEQSAKSSNYYANFIGYYRSYSSGSLMDSTPFAYIGIKGVSGTNNYQQLQIYNTQANVSIYSGATLSLTGSSSVRLYEQTYNSHIDVDYYGTDMYTSNAHIKIERNNNHKIDIYSSASGNTGHIVLENGKLYFDGGGLNDPLYIQNSKIYVSNLYNGNTNLIDRINNAYSWSNNYNNSGLGYEGELEYIGTDRKKYYFKYNARGQITEQGSLSGSLGESWDVVLRVYAGGNFDSTSNKTFHFTRGALTGID